MTLFGVFGTTGSTPLSLDGPFLEGPFLEGPFRTMRTTIVDAVPPRVVGVKVEVDLEVREWRQLLSHAIAQSCGHRAPPQ